MKPEIIEQMEQREHQRIDLPLVVEISHAVIGTVETTARDISDGGIYVHMPAHKLHQGANIKLRLRTTAIDQVDNTPKIDAQIVRTEADGFAAAFKNRTAEHLWSSVERVRQSLVVGKDLFQVYEAYAISHADKGVLLVQHQGRWQFPGAYLEIGEGVSANGTRERNRTIESLVGLKSCTDEQVIDGRALIHSQLPEASTYAITFHLHTQQTSTRLHSSYRSARWLKTANDVNDVTFAHTWLRGLVMRLIEENSD